MSGSPYRAPPYARIVLELLAYLFLKHGLPQDIRSDNGPEFIEKALRGWLAFSSHLRYFKGDDSPALQQYHQMSHSF